MGCSELSQPQILDAERCVSSLKSTVLFGAMFFVEGSLGFLWLQSLFKIFFVGSKFHLLN